MTMCSMNTRKSIFFSQTSVRIQLHDTKGVKSHSENRKLDEETLVSMKVYLFHTDFSPSSTLQVTWIRNVSQKIFLHNLFYVLLFVVSFTDCIFDAFNCRNHCIFKILCVRHRYIFPCTATNRCI